MWDADKKPDRHLSNDRESDTRRAAERSNGSGFHFVVTLDADDGPEEVHAAALMDFSTTGCGLYQVDEPAAGQRFGIVLVNNGTWHARVAIVRNTDLTNNGWYRVGLQFVETPQAVQDTLIGFVRVGFERNAA